MFRAAATPRRSRRSLVLSLLLHAGAVMLASLAANDPAGSRPDSLTFLASNVPMRAPLIVNVPEPVAEPRPEPEPLIAPDLPEPGVEFAPPAPEPARQPGPAPEREAAALPRPSPAAEPESSDGGAEVGPAAPAGEVVVSGFDREVAEAPLLIERTTVVGVLDAPSNARRNGPARRAAAVASTGFDGAPREPAPAAPRGGAARPAGFDASAEAAGPALGADQEVVTGVAGFGAPAAPEAEPPPPAPAAADSGFEVDLPDAPEAEPAAAPSGPPDSPVEIEFKPTPEYSDEARAAGIEGDVLLEVEFSAAGVARVLRVIEGLGYGLDALAVQAAEQMRFTPAVRNGQPVDTRAVVSITFRLA